MINQLPTNQPEKSKIPIGTIRKTEEPKDPADDFTAMQTIESSIVRNNLPAAVTRRGMQHVQQIFNNGLMVDDPDFRPYADKESNLGYPPEIFLGVRSEEEREFRKRIHNEENYDIAAMNARPILSTIASMGSAGLDPTFMVPVVGWGLRGATMGARMARSAGASAGIELVAETGFHALQETRTLEETALNVAVSGMVGGLIGRFAKTTLSPEEMADISKKVYDEVDSLNVIAKDPRRYDSKYVTTHTYDADTIAAGRDKIHFDLMRRLQEEFEMLNDGRAAKTADMIIDDMMDAGTEMRDVYPVLGPTSRDIVETNISDFLDPFRRELSEPVLTDLGKNAPKQLNRALAFLAKATPARLLGSSSNIVRDLAINMGEQNIVGTTRHAIETAVKRYEAPVSRVLEDMSELFGVYKTSGGKLKADAFGGAALDHIRWGNATDPAVQALAKSLQTKVFKPMLKKAIDAGVFTAEQAKKKFGEGYVPRFINRGALRDGEHQFLEDIKNAVMKGGKSTEADAKEIATELYRKLTGNNETFRHTGKIMVSGSKHGKARTLEIPDKILAPYLNNNLDFISTHYSRSMAGEIEIRKRFGNADLKEQIVAIQDEYDKLKAGKSPTEVAKLSAQQKADIRDLEAIRDRLLGFYGTPDDVEGWYHRAANSISHLNVVTMLGRMTVSAFPDVARPIWAHGLAPWAKGIKQLLTNFDGFMAQVEDMRVYHAGLSTALDHRARSFAGTDYNPHTNTMFEKAVESVSMGGGTGGVWGFDKLSGMAHWNASMKAFSSVISANELIRKASKGTKATARDIKDMADLGINEDMAARIAHETKINGVPHKGGTVANTDKWDDAQAARAYEMAIIKETDSTVVTPGILDKPLVMDSSTGRLFGQFQSFAFGAHNKMLIAGMNNGDIRTMMGLLSSIVLGMMTVDIKRRMDGREIEDEETYYEELLLAGIMQSGALGAVGTLFDRVGKPLAKGERGQSVVASAVGPTGKSAEKLWDGVGIGGRNALMGKEMTDATYRGLTGLAPYNNLFYLDTWLNQFQDKE